MEEHGDKSAGVLCVGRVYCDIIFTGIDNFPKLGEEKFATGVSLHAGGGAYITAAYLASLGRPVSLLATLPSGP
ncbi:MAG: sugar/nucleoside kinase (ribokinase family), partial [Porticoccaceae bacterium]